MIESTDFLIAAGRNGKQSTGSQKNYTEPQQQCKVTADQVAHQLLLNGKGNKLRRCQDKLPQNQN